MSDTLSKTEFSAPPTTLTGRRDGRRTAPLRGIAGALFARWRDGLARLLRRPPPLNLELPDRVVHFRSMREFEFALASRTEFPASRVGVLIAFSPADLENAATRLRDAERRLSKALARSVSDSSLTGELFRELEPRLFSGDHGWRDIVDALKRQGPAWDDYKRVALIKYLQYLRARQTVMRGVFVEKTRDDDDAGLHATRALPDAGPGGGPVGGQGGDQGGGDTSLFDVVAAPDDAPVPGESGYRTLPKGETVAVDPGDARHVELLLAGNRLRLYTGRECYLVDDGNNAYPLKRGKNLVGRHAGCDVSLDAACKAISRTHLIIEPLPGGSVLLTDLSSHGTEVDAARLPAR